MLLRGSPNKVTKGKAVSVFPTAPQSFLCSSAMVALGQEWRTRASNFGITGSARDSGPEGGRKFPGSRLYKCGGVGGRR